MLGILEKQWNKNLKLPCTTVVNAGEILIF